MYVHTYFSLSCPNTFNTYKKNFIYKCLSSIFTINSFLKVFGEFPVFFSIFPDSWKCADDFANYLLSIMSQSPIPCSFSQQTWWDIWEQSGQSPVRWIHYREPSDVSPPRRTSICLSSPDSPKAYPCLKHIKNTVQRIICQKHGKCNLQRLTIALLGQFPKISRWPTLIGTSQSRLKLYSIFVVNKLIIKHDLYYLLQPKEASEWKAPHTEWYILKQHGMFT